MTLLKIGIKKGGIIMPNLYQMASEWSTKELKKEYTRLRSRFVKQIERLSAARPNDRKVKIYGKGGYKYPLEIAKIESTKGRAGKDEKYIKEDWAFRVAELQQMVNAPSLSLSGRQRTKRKIITSLQESGYKINNKNFDLYTSFMNFINEKYSEFYEPRYAEIFAEWINGGKVTDSDMEKYIAQWEEWKKKKESEDLFI